MKITMRTLAKGPQTHLEVGKTYDVPNDLGRQFIDGRYAVLAEKPEPQKPVEQKSDTQKKK